MKKHVFVLLTFLLFYFANFKIVYAQNNFDWFTPGSVHSSNDIRRTGNLIDSNLGNAWTPNVWIQQSYWVVFDLGKEYEIEKIRSWHNKQWDRETAIMEIYVSNDINNWGESVGNILEIYNKPQGWYESSFSKTNGRYVKMVSGITKCPYWREIQVYGGSTGQIQMFSLNINSENGTVLKSSNLSEFESGTVVRLTSIPNDGFVFSNWSGDVSGTANPIDIVMDGNKNVTANYSMIITDSTPPIGIVNVRDGSGADLTETNIADQLTANWDLASDSESGITRYWYAIGTSAGNTNIVDWTSAGNNTQVTRTGLSLISGTTYYFSIRAENGAGLLSVPTNSNGVLFTDSSIPVSHEISITCEPGTDISGYIQSAANYLERIGGGTIYLPTGEFLFNKTVAMAGGINLIGQGLENTILNSKTTSFIDINHNGNKGGAMRISGISFMGWTSDAGYTHRGISLSNIVDFRIDHIYIEGCGYTINISGRPNYPKPRGVIDHCTIIKGRGVYNSVYGVTSGAYLWENENRIENIGTREAVFIEDCYFEGCSHATDAFGGGHYVLRNSTVYNCGSVGGHGVGFDDSGRGIRCAEVYNNIIRKSLDGEDRLRWIMIGIRGGGGVIFNNIIENAQYAIQFTIDTRALVDANGDGIYEYPAKDQTHDRWIWNNTLINVPVLIMHYGIPAQQLILENRDYFLRAPSMELDGFEYTPYPYPHPLTQDVSASIISKNNLTVENTSVEIPKDFYLENAYPNPFNPKTIIRYQIPEDDFVTLKIYDILGKEVCSLVNEQKVAGFYKVEFNASNLPSGIYIYSLQTSKNYQAKKMMLLK